MEQARGWMLGIGVVIGLVGVGTLFLRGKPAQTTPARAAGAFTVAPRVPARNTPATRPAHPRQIIDPFLGGPSQAPHDVPLPPPPPPAITLSNVPPVSPSPRMVCGLRPHFPAITPVATPPGSYVGWISTTNGALAAIFLDGQGQAHTLHIGDSAGPLTLRALAPDMLTMTDAGGKEYRYPLAQ